MRGRQPSRMFIGIPRVELESQLAALQRARFELNHGGKVVTASYAQGDGSKSVTYTTATMSNLVAAILELEEALGLICSARRPIRMLYR